MFTTMENQEEMETLTGTVIFQKSNEGSKSESVQPFLYVNQNDVIHVFMQKSNPFENKVLQAYDGKMITVRGYYNNQSFVIVEISE